MKLTNVKYPVLLPVVLAACFSLSGCASDGSYDYNSGYKSQQQRDDEMAKDAMDEATKSLSKEDIKNIENLGK